MKLSELAHGRDNNFNIIRIVAAFAVLVSHAFRLANLSSEPFENGTGISLGTMAVDVFFITSGFLVTASLLTRKSTLEYLCARALRIFPALLVMVASTAFGLGLYFTAVPVSSYLSSSETYWYIFKNSTLITGVYYFLPGVFEHNPFKGSVNGSLWSMVHEVRCYVILAILWVGLKLVTQNRAALFKAAIVFCAVFCGAWYFTAHFFLSEGGSFRHMGFMFFTGASYYALKERVRLSWILFWVFTGVVLLSSLNKTAFFLSYNLLLAYMLLFLAYIPSGLVRAYNRLGDYSYGVYIYAFPVQQSAEALFPGISWGRMVLLSAPVTLGLAALSWHLLEKRALSLKSSLLDRTRRVVRIQESDPAIRPALREIP